MRRLFGQPLKTVSSNAIFGILTLMRLLQPSNARGEMFVTPWGIVTLKSPLHPKNASRIRKELDNAHLPPPSSREARKIPDLKSENPSFAAMLVKYVNERFGGDAPKVYNAAHVNRKTYSAIVGNELRPVSKTTAVQFALALNLTRAEADEFIKSAGYAFSASILEDIIVCSCIEAKIYDITDVNTLLTEYGSKPFASKEDA